MYHHCLRLAVAFACLLGAASTRADEPATADQKKPAALFDQLDANHDGEVSSDEVPGDKQTLFERLRSTADQDGNGTLSRQEFAAGLESRRAKRAPDQKLPADFGSIPKPAEMDVIFGRLDRNQDGKVVADEVPDEARARFDRFAVIADKDNDGAVTREEMHQAIERVREQFAGSGGNVPPAQIFEYLDRNADGKLTTDEVPTERQRMFERAVRFGDRDKDGALSEEEFTKVVNTVRQRDESKAGERTADQAKASEDSAAADSAKKKGGGKYFVHRLLRLDADHDGKVSLAEFANQPKRRFRQIDADQDGFLDKDEIQKFAAERAAKMDRDKPDAGPKVSAP